MTHAPESETIDLAVVSCEACDELFLLSPHRSHCPTCGGSAGLTFFEFSRDSSGLRLKGMPELSGAGGAGAALTGTTSPAETTPEDRLQSFRNDAAVYLGGGPIEEDHLRDRLMHLGAQTAGVTLVIDHLRYIRGFLESLTWLAGEGRPGDSWFAT